MAATRMTTPQMLPAAPILDEMGFHGLETWGGATIDSCLRYLNENPFDRLRTLKKVAPKRRSSCCCAARTSFNTPAFRTTWWRRSCAACAQNGMDIIRIFDALNDVRNLKPRSRR
jgi:pyruvate carboxylase subunit B